MNRTPALASALTIDNYKITARNGSVLEVMSADAASAFGRKPAIAVADEFRQWNATANARGVWTAITSSMGKVKGAKLLVASTSGDPGSWSHKVYVRATKSKRWSVQDVPGPLPWTSEEFLAEEQASQPESVYRRLHLNQWCAPEDRLTNLEDLRACTRTSGWLEPVAGRRYVLGVDLGWVNDRSVIAVCHSEPFIESDGRGNGVTIVLDYMEVWAGTRSNPVDLTAVEDAIVEDISPLRCACPGRPKGSDSDAPPPECPRGRLGGTGQPPCGIERSHRHGSLQRDQGSQAVHPRRS